MQIHTLYHINSVFMFGRIVIAYTTAYDTPYSDRAAVPKHPHFASSSPRAIA